MKKKRTIILGALALVVLVVLVVVCWKNRYGAKLYGTKGLVEGWIKTEFLEENKVGDVYYFNPECLEDSDENTERYYLDKESPKTRTFLITDEDTFNEIFYEGALDVDFEKEMVILHIFRDWGSSRPYVLKNVSVDDDTVEISMRKQLSLGNSGAIPCQRCVVITMKKLDVVNAKVTE